MLEATFAFQMPPTSEAFNNALTGILPLGIYEGGRVLPNAGLSVRIEPWVGRSKNLTVRNDEFEVVMASTGTHYLVMEAKHLPNAPTLTNWLLLSYDDYLARPDIDELIVFALLVVPSSSTIITPDMIDHAAATRASLQFTDFLGRMFTGTGQFNGTSGTTIDHFLGHTNYAVNVTPSEAPNVGLGDIYVEKHRNSIEVFCTGMANTDFDYTIINKRPAPPLGPTGGIITPIQLVGSLGFSFPHQFSTLDHHVAVFAEDPDPSVAGNIWVDLGADNDIVHNDGSEVKGIAGFFPVTGTSMTFGQDNFTPSGFTTITHGLATMEYFVHVIPIDDTANLNSFWVERQANSFLVHQDGTMTGEFQYLLVTNPNQFIWGDGIITGAVDNRVDHYLNNINYVPLITPNENAGHLSVLRGYNFFEVFAENFSNVEFEYLLLPLNNWS